MAEFKKPYDKAYEFWHVTTKADCEGRSTTDLGVFEENIKGAITMAEFKKPYDKAYGFWHVTTEGDCEGRSITDLGVFEGNIDTIALALADRCYYYTLYFTAVDPTAYDKTPKKDEINISIYGASGMYDMTKEERLDAMRNMLKDRPVFVRDGDHADTFIISTKQESREKRRQKVLDKLTAEERELLGV